jgi:hypothetical protein
MGAHPNAEPHKRMSQFPEDGGWFWLRSDCQVDSVLVSSVVLGRFLGFGSEAFGVTIVAPPRGKSIHYSPPVEGAIELGRSEKVGADGSQGTGGRRPSGVPPALAASPRSKTCRRLSLSVL